MTNDREDMTVQWNLLVLLREFNSDCNKLFKEQWSVADFDIIAEEYVDKIIALFWKRGLLLPNMLAPIIKEEKEK